MYKKKGLAKVAQQRKWHSKQEYELADGEGRDESTTSIMRSRFVSFFPSFPLTSLCHQQMDTHDKNAREGQERRTN
jgi:hypothetical protein